MSDRSPDLSVVVFRVAGPAGDSDRRTQALVDDLRDSGEALLSTTVIDGRLALRFAVMSLTTHRATIDATLAAIDARINGARPLF